MTTPVEDREVDGVWRGRVETLLEGMAKGQDRIEGTLAEIRNANEEWRKAHVKDTQDKLDHARRNTDQALAGLKSELDKKTDKSQSDERYAAVKEVFNTLATKEEVKSVREVANESKSNLAKVAWGVLTPLLAIVAAGLIGGAAYLGSLKEKAPVAYHPAPVVQSVAPAK